MTVGFAEAIRTALLANGSISGLLAEWEAEPAVHTRRPVPSDTLFPFIAVSPDIANTDFDGLSSKRINLMKDILVYGVQPGNYRTVETIAGLVKELFHRERFSIAVDGYHVIQIVATGPSIAPADDDKLVARVVTLNILAQRA